VLFSQASGEKFNFALKYAILTKAARSDMKCSELKSSSARLGDVQTITISPSSKVQEALPNDGTSTITLPASVQLTINSTDCQDVKYLLVMLSDGAKADYIEADQDNNCKTLDLSSVLKCSPGNYQFLLILNPRINGDFCHQGWDTEIAQKCLRLSKHTDTTIHWKALGKHFLMVPLVFL
jgi:hypothetical protein